MKYILISLASLFFLLPSCKNKTGESTTGESKHMEGLIHLNADQIKRAEIVWSPLEQKAINAELSLTGEMRIQPENRAVVSASADGFIFGLNVKLNQVVRRGDLVASLRMYNLVDMQKEYLENRDRMTFLKTEYDRYDALRESNATANKNFLKAAADLRSAETTVQVLAAKLNLYGIDAEHLTAEKVRSELRIYAPLTGMVTAIHLSNGSAVQAGAAICDIADFSALNADLFVYEEDILRVKTGQKVSISFPNAADKILQATVFSIDRVLDSTKNALRAHARIKDTQGLTLIEGTYFDAKLALETAVPMPVLPTEAIVREGLDEYILLLDHEQNGDAFFKPVKVKVQGSENGLTAFSTETPLPAESRLVRKGAYFVWSQSKVEEFMEEE